MILARVPPNQLVAYMKGREEWGWQGISSCLPAHVLAYTWERQDDFLVLFLVHGHTIFKIINFLKAGTVAYTCNRNT